MEIWKPVLGFEELYEVSNIGRFRRISRGKSLTAEKAALAKKLLNDGGTLVAVAAIVGVSYGTTWQIRKGLTWNGDTRYRHVKTGTGKDFYQYIFLCVDGKPKRYSAHRLLWEAFNGPIPYPLQVNHKNLDRSDNRIENLEIVTHAENIRHALAIYQGEGKSHNDGGRYYKNKKHNKINKVVR